MNLYKAHNLLAVHPELDLAATYQLEGEYLAIGQDGHYVALPDKNDVQICILNRGGLCRMNQALYTILATIAVFIWKVYQMRGTLGKLRDIPNVIKSESNILGMTKASRKAKEVVFEFSEGATKATPMSPATRNEILERALEHELKGNPKQLKKYFKSLDKKKMKTIPETDSELSS